MNKFEEEEEKKKFGKWLGERKGKEQEIFSIFLSAIHIQNSVQQHLLLLTYHPSWDYSYN